jgi:serine/threonine protein kinase
MPPEQADGEAVTAASDWYSLGVVLYQALCGELPFPGSVQQMTDAKLRYRLSAPGAVASGVDPELEQLALALLDPKPERRPAEADIMKALSQNATSCSFLWPQA